MARPLASFGRGCLGGGKRPGQVQGLPFTLVDQGEGSGQPLQAGHERGDAGPGPKIAIGDMCQQALCLGGNALLPPFPQFENHEIDEGAEGLHQVVGQGKSVVAVVVMEAEGGMEPGGADGPGDHCAQYGVSPVEEPVLVLAVAAAAGAAELAVYRQPRVAIMVTGSELVDPSAKPTGGQIRNSNGPMLDALVRDAHAEPVDIGTVGDDKRMLSEHVRRGLESDILCISGGGSMGAFDFVPEVLAECGVRTIVRKMALKPGKPTVFGISETGTCVFGLPGNPIGAFVAFWLLVRLAIDVVSASIESINPDRGQRTSHVCAYAMSRALAAGSGPPPAGRAGTKHRPQGVMLSRPFEALCPWQLTLGLRADLRAVVNRLPAPGRRFVRDRYGLGGNRPRSLAELAEQTGRTPTAVARLLAGAQTQLRREATASAGE